MTISLTVKVKDILSRIQRIMSFNSGYWQSIDYSTIEKKLLETKKLFSADFSEDDIKKFSVYIAQNLEIYILENSKDTQAKKEYNHKNVSLKKLHSECLKICEKQYNNLADISELLTSPIYEQLLRYKDYKHLPKEFEKIYHFRNKDNQDKLQEAIILLMTELKKNILCHSAHLSNIITKDSNKQNAGQAPNRVLLNFAMSMLPFFETNIKALASGYNNYKDEHDPIFFRFCKHFLELVEDNKKVLETNLLSTVRYIIDNDLNLCKLQTSDINLKKIF